MGDSGEVFWSVDPATEEVVAEYESMSAAQIEETLGRAQAAFQHNSRQPLSWRSERMLALAEGLRRDGESLAQLVTREMGKPVGEARAEVEKCAISCQYFAHQAEQFLMDQPMPSDSPRSFVAFRPLGVILAIMPWNFPLWQVIRFAAPALMAGNSALLKHAPTTFGCARALERLVEEAGFPEGSLASLVIGTDPIAAVIADARVRAVTLTGSDRAGSRVAELAGRALKKSVLELGGSDFFLVLADAELSQAAEVGVRARFQNAGQSCIAAKRFLVAAEVADEYLERFQTLAAALPVGNPTDPRVRMGPMARKDLRDQLHDQVLRSQAAGAVVVLGGRPSEGPGFFYPATLLTSVDPSMPAFLEETFGPVASFTRFSTEEEAISLANHPHYGLGGNIWTADPEHGVALAGRMDTGGVFVNGMTHSDARIPFGGVRRSGFGRELASFGIHEFTNVQTVWRP
ncbi:MAG TPA: NAD-dependent succinate-semialdehyde dehydrogenase [Candidatus Dormibacteraeota bacterium]|nr:NAD-dependent succinate-semialdehyde dehydrogenase [Candidatus Dormibacteraeota bacterium]